MPSLIVTSYTVFSWFPSENLSFLKENRRKSGSWGEARCGGNREEWSGGRGSKIYNNNNINNPLTLARI